MPNPRVGPSRKSVVSAPLWALSLWSGREDKWISWKRPSDRTQQSFHLVRLRARCHGLLSSVVKSNCVFHLSPLISASDHESLSTCRPETRRRRHLSKGLGK